MSSSAAHAQAARQNGKLSHGPVTASGKSRSSQNARKHNLLGSIALLSHEDRAEFDAIADGFIQEFEPQTPTEIRFIREMADAEFRLQRVRLHAASIQDARARQVSDDPGDDEAAEAFRQLAEEGPTLALLLRYEAQFRRQFEKALQMFQDFRLRERADKEKIKNAQAQAYVEMMKDLVDLPMPGQETPKSNPISFPNEPNRPSPKQPGPLSRLLHAVAGGTR